MKRVKIYSGLLFLVVFYILLILKDGYCASNRYEALLTQVLNGEAVTSEVISNANIKFIDANRLLISDAASLTPSLEIKTFLKNQYPLAPVNTIYADYNDFKAKLDIFKQSDYSNLILEYNIPKKYPDSLKLSLAYLVSELNTIPQSSTLMHQLVNSYRITQLLEYMIEYLRGECDFSKIKSQYFGTPEKKIVVGGTENNSYSYPPYFIIIDFGGDDQYSGAVASASPDLQKAILIDFSGNDIYKCSKNDKGAQGAGISGIGILFDLDGSDKYDSLLNSQGFGGQNGVGILWDRNGDDVYLANTKSQGVAINKGFGLLLDNDGKDSYTANGEDDTCLSQGTGYGVNSFGILIDLMGDDKYVSKKRGAQASGWWGGLGILFDKSGNDSYTGEWYVQGAAPHGGRASFFDMSGDDIYYVLTTQGLASAKGFDNQRMPSIAAFVDESGNDIYNFDGDSCAVAINNSLAFFIDIDGQDKYIKGNMGRAYLNGEVVGFNLTLGIFYDGGNKKDEYLDKKALADNNKNYKNKYLEGKKYLVPSGDLLEIFKDE